MTSMAWNIFIGQLPGCAASHLLHTHSLAEYEKLEKVLDFIATTINSSVITILHIQNTKKKQLLGRKLTLSQPKPGHWCVMPFFFAYKVSSTLQLK